MCTLCLHTAFIMTAPSSNIYKILLCTLDIVRLCEVNHAECCLICRSHFHAACASCGWEDQLVLEKCFIRLANY
jgi:hypothetical protein